MKKTLSLILAAVLCVGFCACGGNPTTTALETTPVTTAPAEEKVYKLGDSIETSLFKITPVFTGYAKELANWPDENYMTPAGKTSGTSPYNAGEGKVSMYGEMQIEYIGNEKSDVSLKIGVSVDYDNGYVFGGNAVHFGNCISVTGDWDYDAEMKFEALSSSTTRILRYCVEVPEQVETNADKSLLVTISVNGETFLYDFRSAEVLASDYDPRDVFYQPIDAETKAKIVTYLKKNGLKQSGWYDKTVGTYTFTFGDTDVSATLPINKNYAYDFNGTYEVYSGSILLSWDYGEQMHLDYTFDGTTLTITEFGHDR